MALDSTGTPTPLGIPKYATNADKPSGKGFNAAMDKLDDLLGKELHHFNVKKYGAKGDGTTDDTAAIQAAITAAGTSGIVFFPAGTYKITSSLVIGEAYSLTLAGTSMEGSIITQATNNTPIIKTASGSSLNIRVQIRDLCLQYTTLQTSSHTNSYAISWEGASFPMIYEWVIERVRVIGAYVVMGNCKGGLTSNGPVWGLTVRDCWFSRTVKSAVEILANAGAPSTLFSRIYVDNNSGPTTVGPAFALLACEATFEEIDLEGWTGRAFQCAGQSQPLVIRNIHVESHVLTGDYPILFEFSDGGVIFDGGVVSGTVSATVGTYARLFTGFGWGTLDIRGLSTALTLTTGLYITVFDTQEWQPIYLRDFSNGGPAFVYAPFNPTLSNPANGWAKGQGAQGFNVRDFGALGDGTTNDQAAIQAAINACAVAGGGTVFFPKGTYLLNTRTVNSLLNIPDGARNLRLLGEKGATLTTTLGNTGFAMFISGGVDTAVIETMQEPVYTLSGSYTTGVMSLTLATPAQASNFAVGDYILIRTGQTIDGFSDQPDCEVNRVRARDTGTGVITLEWPTTKPYAQEYYVSGTSGRTSTVVTANPAPYGVANINALTIVNLTIEGLRFYSPDQGYIGLGGTNAGVNCVIRDCEFEGNRGYFGFPVSPCRFFLVENCRAHDIDGNSDTRYHLAADKGMTNGVWRDNFLSVRNGIAQMHVHEGVSDLLIEGNVVQSATGFSGDDKPSLSLRARFYNIRARNNTFMNGAGNVIYVDNTSSFAGTGYSGGLIEGNRFRGSFGNAVGVDSDGWTVRENEGGNVTLSTLGSNAEEVVVPIGAFSPASGATLGLVGPTSYQGLTLADGSTQSGIATLQIPQHWLAYDVHMLWTNLGAGSGNVALGLLMNDVTDGTSINVADDVSTGPSSLQSAPAQYVTKTTKMNSVPLPVTRSGLQKLNLYRVGADASDTLAASIAILGVRLRRIK